MFFMEASDEIQQTAGLTLRRATNSTMRHDDRHWSHHDATTGGPESERDPTDVLLSEPAIGCSLSLPGRPEGRPSFGGGGANFGSYPPYMVAKTDYAANGGSVGFNFAASCPWGSCNDGGEPNDSDTTSSLLTAGTPSKSVRDDANKVPQATWVWYPDPTQ